MRYYKIILITLLICLFKQTNGQTYLELNKKCSEILNGIPIGDSIFWVRLNQRDSCLIGLKAPSLDITTIGNEKIKTESLQGKVLFLNFWFTNCKPCIKEMPILNKIVKTYKNKDVVFISFANDDYVKLQRFLKAKKFNFKVVPNASRILIDTFKLFAAWPTSIIIDKNGIIRLIKTGEIKPNETNELISKLLK